MAARSIATLSLTFGLVSIPVKVYSATESTSAIRFKLMAPGGARVRQQYVTSSAPPPVEEALVEEPPVEEPPVEERPVGDRPVEARHAAAPHPGASSRVLDFPSPRRTPVAPPTEASVAAEPAVIERSEMMKGYEFEKGKFVLFSADELKALEQGSRQTIDIVAFIPAHSVDPIHYDKAYFLAPDKRGAKPYHLLLRAMRETGRSALAKWAFRSKEYVVEIRPGEGGMVLQQLLYADEVRSLADLDIDEVTVSETELKLAKQLIEQISAETYDPSRFVDEEKERILAAVEKKIAGKQIVAPEQAAAPAGAQVLDLVEALRASLQPRATSTASARKTTRAAPLALGERKPVKRAAARPASDAVPLKGRSKKR